MRHLKFKGRKIQAELKLLEGEAGQGEVRAVGSAVYATKMLVLGGHVHTHLQTVRSLGVDLSASLSSDSRILGLKDNANLGTGSFGVTVNTVVVVVVRVVGISRTTFASGGGARPL